MIMFNNPEKMKEALLKDERFSAIHSRLHLLGATHINELFKSAYPDTWQDMVREWDSKADYKVPRRELSRMVVFDNDHAKGNAHKESREAKTLIFKK